MIMDKNSDNIKVMVRVRPLNTRERSEEGKICVILDDYRPSTLTLDAKPEPKSFNFDWVGGDGTTQQNIFEAVGKAMVQTCLEGYNCCIFAYGQTGAGKTYTMQGRGLDMDNEDMTHRGLQPRVFDYIFGQIRGDTEENVDTKYLVSCTYLEIYNEQIMDLLEPVGATLQIREDLKKGVYVEGLKEEAVDNSEDTIELLRKGAINRHVGSTNMNMESSRSHSLFTMTIERKTIANGTIHVRTSKFHFVDLAGSERQKMTAAAGDRLKEAGNINKSLSVLGQVINSLVEIAEGKQRHIRYRDSKLTFILKDSLGGNSKTCLIANISPASSSFAETLSTLKFAQRAKQIKNKASINEDSTGSVEGLKNEIRLLKEELGKCRGTIANYENGGAMQTVRSPPKLTPHSNNFGISPEAQRALYEQNQRSMELEIQLKQTIEVLSENELLLQVELDKKEEYLNMFKSAVDLYETNEVQYRSVILLNRSKAERLSRVVAGKISEMSYNMLLEVENTQLKKENSCVVEILRSTPLIMKIFRDNVEMRERMEVLDSEWNPNSTFSIAKQIHENLFYLQQLTLKIEEDIKERRVLNDRLERIGGGGSSGRGGIGSPEKHRRLEDDIRQLKLEHGQQIDRLNFEILELRGLEMEARRIAEIESKKHFDLLREHESLKESKQRNEEKYEKKMNELYQEFQRIQLAKFDVDSLGSELDQMNLKCMEYKEQAMSYKEKYEDMLQLYQEMEECVKHSIVEKETNEQEYREEVNRKDIEKGILENNVVSLENKLNIAGDDLAKYKEELDNLTKTLSEFYSKENEYNLQLDSLYHENIQQTEKFAKIEEQKNEQIMQAQAMLEKQKMSLETLETDRNKIQEELDTLSQILNYNIDELEGKKALLLEAQVKIGEQEKTMNDMKEEMTRQKDSIQNLQQQIYDQNHESSPYNLALKENARLNEQLTQVSVQIRALETESDQRKEELCEARLRINELNESVQDYTSAYKDAMSKLETKSGELKETQNNLELRVAEMAQLEQELKASNDNTMKREKELEDLAENLKTIEKNKAEVERELNMKNQENEDLVKVGQDLEKKISVLEADIEEMKTVLENKVEEHKQEIERQKKLFEEKLEEIKGELKRAEEKIEGFVEQMGILEQAKKNLQEELNKKEKIINGLNEKAEDYLKQMGTLEQAKKDLQEELNKKEEIINGLNEKTEGYLEQIGKMEQAKKSLQEEINKKEEIINGLNGELEEKAQEIEEGKKRIKEEGEKVAELEKQGLVKEEDIKRYIEEIEKIKLRNEELENEIQEINKTIETEYINKEEYNKQVGEMQTLLKEQEGHHEETISKLREEYDKEQEKITEEKAEREEIFARKEQEYEQQIDETTAKLNEALQELSAGGIREMKAKIEEQEKDLNEYIETLNQMKGQIEHCVQVMEQLTEENDRLKEEAEKLRGELKNEKELVIKMNLQAAGLFRQLEIEVAKMKEMFDKLNEQHQFIMATVSIKEGEITKCREEIRLMLLEKEKMLDDIMKLREHEVVLKQAKEESDDKVSLLNNEKLALMVQLDTVEKANSQLIGHNNKQQKVDYLTKLKEEGNKLRDEKVKLQEKLNKAQEKSEQLQKKLDELARKNNLDPAKLASEISESQYLMHELEKLKVEHKLSNEVLVMLNELLNESFYNRKSRSNGYHHNNKNDTEKDINKVLENVQKYLKILKEKEREVREKERDMDAKKLQLNILEREVALLRQKFKLSVANPDVDADVQPQVQPQAQNPAQNYHYNRREDKENDQKENSHNHSSAKKKAELNIDKPLQAHNITGLKRNLDELITGPSNKSKIEKTERKLAMGGLKFKKDKRDQMAGKESVGRLSEIPVGMKQEDEEMLRNSLTVGDEFMNIGFEELKKKMKME